MSSSIRCIRIEVSGTAVIYTLMSHHVNHSLLIPLISDYSHVDPIILYSNGLLLSRQIIILRYYCGVGTEHLDRKPDRTSDGSAIAPRSFVANATLAYYLSSRLPRQSLSHTNPDP